MMDQDVRCPNCGTTKYANVNLRMMVNVCGHSLCESCVELLFVKGASKCPTCGVVLKRAQFRIQLYDDEGVEKDLEIRRRLLRDINLKEDDFDNLKDYNNYLEMFETFVYNLANNIDTAETTREIEQFKSANAAKLAKARNKVSKDMELIEQLLEEEREMDTSRSLDRPPESGLNVRQAAAAKEKLVDDLLASDMQADVIMQSFQERLQSDLAAMNEFETQRQNQRAMALAAKRHQTPTFSSGIRIGAGAVDDDDEYRQQENINSYRYQYQAPVIMNSGPPCPTPRTITRNNYLQHIRAPNASDLAGGFNALYPCQRALQEAIIDLSFIPSHATTGSND